MFGWLARLVALFTLLGVLAFDGVKIVVATFGAADDAATAAQAAADSYRAAPDVQAAYDAAVQSLAGKADVVETKTFTVASDGRIDLVVQRHPTTLWLHRISPLKRFVTVQQAGVALPSP